jgi:hypothetical protein
MGKYYEFESKSAKHILEQMIDFHTDISAPEFLK